MTSAICDDKQHSGRNSLMDMRHMVKTWRKNGQISDQDYLLFLVKFDRLQICTKLFGKPSDQAPQKEVTHDED